MAPALSTFVFMGFTAAYLAIRGAFIRRARRRHKTDESDARDRLLIALSGVGQLVLPSLFVWTLALNLADRAQPIECICLGAMAMAMTIGLWVFWRSHVGLGENWSVTLELDAQHRLVTRGVYRLVRHPMYTSFFISGLGQALLISNWIAGPAALAAVTVLVVVRVPRTQRQGTCRTRSRTTLASLCTGRLSDFRFASDAIHRFIRTSLPAHVGHNRTVADGRFQVGFRRRSDTPKREAPLRNDPI